MPDFSKRECCRSSNVRGRVLKKDDESSGDGPWVSDGGFRLTTGVPHQKAHKQNGPAEFMQDTSPNPTQALSVQRPVTDLVMDLWEPEVV